MKSVFGLVAKVGIEIDGFGEVEGDLAKGIGAARNEDVGQFSVAFDEGNQVGFVLHRGINGAFTCEKVLKKRGECGVILGT